jgi:hypothetical protein
MIRIRNEKDGIDTALEVVSATDRCLEIKPDSDAKTEAKKSLSEARQKLTDARAAIDRIR